MMRTEETAVRKQNFSKKREAVYRAIAECDSHPTAEWVYMKLKPEFPSLSLGTVYRNIAKFREDGTIVSVGIIDGHEHYDAVTKPHGHFICKRCNLVMDVFNDHISSEVLESVAKDLGVQITHHKLKFYGLCPKCCVVDHENDSL